MAAHASCLPAPQLPQVDFALIPPTTHLTCARAQEAEPPVLPPACREDARPRQQLEAYMGQCRAHLLDVGIIRPSPSVSAHDISLMVQRRYAPPPVGKIADPDKIDVSRFLNRRAPCW